MDAYAKIFYGAVIKPIFIPNESFPDKKEWGYEEYDQIVKNWAEEYDFIGDEDTFYDIWSDVFAARNGIEYIEYDNENKTHKDYWDKKFKLRDQCLFDIDMFYYGDNDGGEVYAIILKENKVSIDAGEVSPTFDLEKMQLTNFEKELKEFADLLDLEIEEIGWHIGCCLSN